jgi:hypothetical protein
MQDRQDGNQNTRLVFGYEFELILYILAIPVNKSV